MTIARTGWLKTVGLKDYECQACGWNVTAGEPRVYTYAGEGRPHKVTAEYKLDEKSEPVIELEESVEFVYHSFCYNMPTIPSSESDTKVYKYEDYKYLTVKRDNGDRNEWESPITYLDLGEGHE